MNEIWKEVRGYKNYMVSSAGKVRSKERYVKHSSGNGEVLRKGRTLKLLNHNYGYVFVILQDHGRKSTITVHKLVAEAFIPNTDNKPQINHKNGIKTDNVIENLEWCSASENVKHAWDIGLNKDRERDSKGKFI